MAKRLSNRTAFNVFIPLSQMALVGGGQGMAGGNAAPQQNCVLMFYGMNGEMMNCERLFNLVCLYGNVVRIKFLKSKDGAAMVQVG